MGNLRLGTIELKTGECYCTDPCYKPDSEVNNLIKMKPGVYEIVESGTKHIEDEGDELWIMLVGTVYSQLRFEQNLDCSVDSGIVSFWDKEEYEKFHQNFDEWWDSVCNNVFKKSIYKTRHGCARSTKYGDDVYPITLGFNRDNECVYASIFHGYEEDD